MHSLWGATVILWWSVVWTSCRENWTVTISQIQFRRRLLLGSGADRDANNANNELKRRRLRVQLGRGRRLGLLEGHAINRVGPTDGRVPLACGGFVRRSTAAVRPPARSLIIQQRRSSVYDIERRLRGWSVDSAGPSVQLTSGSSSA